MALSNFSNALKVAFVNAFLAQLDVGSANAEGAIEIRTAGGAALLFSVPLQAADFTVSAAGVATYTSIPPLNTDAAGTAALGRYVNRDGATIAETTVTVTGGGGDVQLDSLSIAFPGVQDPGSITLEFTPA